MANQRPSRIHQATRGAAWVVVAVALIAPFEGYYGHVYRDSVGVKTICYGQTAADGADFSKVYTKDQCLTMLGNDLPKYDVALQKCLKPAVYAALPPRRHAALVSLTYNVGQSAFCHSSVVRDLNAGRTVQACNDFLKFNRGGGRVIQGLTNRRVAERKVCLEGD